MIGNAGLALDTYPYFDKATASIRFDAMLDTLKTIPKGDVVLLHACCHNPTGADLTQDQWRQVAEVAQQQGWLPFIDSAYLGFGDDLETDAFGMRLMVESVPEVIIAASCSKNFGLYRERVGLAVMVTENSAQTPIVQSQIQAIARGIYSMPPSYGGALVDIILHDDALKASWVAEVDEMRNRMRDLRALLVTKMAENGAPKDFSFVNDQKGMFSFLCITPEQVQAVRAEHSVDFVDSSPVNIAGINLSNVDALSKALVSVF